MAAPMLLRQIVWKEYRQQRGFWLVLALFAIAVQAIVVWSAVLDNRSPDPSVLFGLALGLPCLFAVGCGATLFAGEHESGTYDTMRALPITSQQVLAGKLMCAVGGLLAMPLVLWISAILFSRADFPSEAKQLMIVLGGLVTSLELLAWGMFFSLLMQRPLWAVILAAGTASAVGFVALPLLSWELFAGPAYDQYLQTLPLRSVVAILVLALDIWLALGWLENQPRRLIIPLWTRWKIALGRRSTSDSSQPGNRMLLRLAWQEWRQSRGTILSIFGILGTLQLLFLFGATRSGDMELYGAAFWTLPLTATLFGGCVFLGDQTRNSFRFFAEHGVGGRRVWLSRHLVWAGFFALWVMVGVFFLFVLVGNAPNAVGLTWEDSRWNWLGPIESGGYNVPVDAVRMFFGVLGLSFVAYSASQVGSLFLRSGVVGLFIGMFLAFFACIWCVLMTAAHVPLIWSAVPLPLLLLWATWLRAPDWVVERTTTRAKVYAAMSLASPVLLVFGVIAYRVFETPAVSLPPLDEVARSATREERITANLYDEAIELVRAHEQSQTAGGASEPSEMMASGGLGSESATPALATPSPVTPDAATAAPASPASVTPETAAPETATSAAATSLNPAAATQNARPEKNKAQRAAAIEKFLQASRRPDCRFDNTRIQAGQWPGIRELPLAMLSYGSQLEAEGDREKAAEIYFAVTRFAKHLYQTETAVHQVSGDWAEGAALERLVSWSAATVLSADDIRRMRERLENECFSYSPRRDLAVLHDYMIQSKMIDELDSNTSPQVRKAAVILDYMPWEKIRIQRLLKHAATYSLRELSGLRHEQGPSTEEELSRLKIQLQSTVLISPLFGVDVTMHPRAARSQEAIRGAARIRLAILQWRAEHGELPQRISVLAEYLGNVPADPFTGQPFLYRPEGVGYPFAQSAQIAYLIDPKGERQISGHTPFIWCAGPNLRYQAPQRPTLAEDEVHLTYYRVWGGATVVSMHELFQVGWCFDIPATGKAR